MSARRIHQRRAVFSSSNVRDALATTLTQIKEEDELTDADLGSILGKSKERAREYRLGLSTMDAETLGRGKMYWNGRFTGLFDRLCIDSRPGVDSDRSIVTAMLNACSALNSALEDDDEIDAEEVWDHRAILEEARDHLDAQLTKVNARVARIGGAS